VVEAKAPGERLDRHAWQPRAYCVILNGEASGRTVNYYILTNGLETRLYHVDRNQPVVTLRFADFVDGNRRYAEFRSLIARSALDAPEREPSVPSLEMYRRSLPEVNAAFSWCHQHIYKKDHISQAESFTEFVKLISLKLISDRRIRETYPEIIDDPAFEVPLDDVTFSVDWIERQERFAHNPISDIQFRNFMNDREAEIVQGIRKRMFDANDSIRLRPETIKGVVRRLENIFLLGIDADLNGRLFETFLNATMRGKDLGQFFTPRSLVKLGLVLAQLRVGVVQNNGERHTDSVIDACCGSGGFLIDALADMWSKADAIPLSDAERMDLKREIANDHIVGVDVANAPKLARIARLNMFLHGDGGARIYHLDALDKRLMERAGDGPDTAAEKAEFRRLTASPAFDVALTNPPFAKALDRSSQTEREILDQYVIAQPGQAGRQSVRSSLLFLERYRDLLKPGGKLVTVIDDGILGGDSYRWFREQLREWFLIRAVVSVPGDAFQRSNARVKTSYLVAERRGDDDSQDQPPIFMYPCQFVGLDDPKRQRARAGDAELRVAAEVEIQTVRHEYRRFQNGESDQYSVPAGEASERLDVKNRLFSPGRLVSDWRARGFITRTVEEFLQERIYDPADVITRDHPDPVRVLVVRYSGVAEEIEEVFPSESSYSQLYPVRAGDIVISNIAASHGSIAVVPQELDGCVVSSEYTVLQAKDGYAPEILHLILRSPEVRSDILLSASGANRTRARWDNFRTLEIPYPSPQLSAEALARITDADAAIRAAETARTDAKRTIEQGLHLRSAAAETVLAAFKPPK
jgi:type I restriction enzyme M protein